MQGKLKPMPLSDLFMVLVAGVSVTSGTTASETRPEFRPVPDGVVELTGISGNGSIVEVKDDSLMLAQGGSYRISRQGYRHRNYPDSYWAFQDNYRRHRQYRRNPYPIGLHWLDFSCLAFSDG